MSHKCVKKYVTPESLFSINEGLTNQKITDNVKKRRPANRNLNSLSFTQAGKALQYV